MKDNEEQDEDQDSDFVAEEDRMHDVDVDMRDFHINTDGDINNQINAELDDNIILDNDILESGYDTDEMRLVPEKKLLKYLRRVHANDTNFYIGQVFGNKVEAKKLIKELAVLSRRGLKIIKDDATRVRAVCEGELPNFEIDGSRILIPCKIKDETNSASWMVKTFRDVHTCLQSRSIKHCTATFLANKLLEQIEENPNIPVKAVQKQF
ncbi:hypothetical protein QVD17_20050 [Tagetes erecta]|uniref:Uncharacterized protein n=1 Tax=Tagetes erecta TaxID=13708 RepID=A0AAD8NXU2_TARER|nr:hypothetical protein QVD17_20050 [Tagetes erecta]